MKRRRRKLPAAERMTEKVARFFRHPRTGRFISRKDANKFEKPPTGKITTQRDELGRIRRGGESYTDKSVIIKTGYVAGPRGMDPGRVDSAIYATNASTKLKGARRIIITVRGKDKKDKAHRIKKVVSIDKGTKPAKASDFMIWGILQAMRQRGYRTQYNIDTATFTYRKWNKTKARRMKPLHDVSITVRIEK